MFVLFDINKHGLIELYYRKPASRYNDASTVSVNHRSIMIVFSMNGPRRVLTTQISRSALFASQPASLTLEPKSGAVMAKFDTPVVKIEY